MPGRDDATIQLLAQRIADAIKAHLQAFESQVPVGSWQFADLRQFHYSKH